MIVLEGHELVTSHAITVLKPYVGEAHLISSILVLTRLFELERFSFLVLKRFTSDSKNFFSQTFA